MRIGSLKLGHHKKTADFDTAVLPVPERVRIPVNQHIGAPLQLLVKAGDRVRKGQKIADAESFMSAPIHSSVSGTVKAVVKHTSPNGAVCDAVEIETDGTQEVSSEVCPPKIESRADFLKAVRESGAIGMGGAGFPTHVKLGYDRDLYMVDTLIVNAAECEPYITSDYREVMESTADVVAGAESVMRYLEIPKALFCLESRSAAAIKKLEQAVVDKSGMEVRAVKTVYPQGAEKVAIYNLTGRVVAEGKLPVSTGVLVMNVTTLGFLGRYLKTGMPFLEKRLTVDGDIVRTACNVKVPVGTFARDVLAFADAKPELAEKIIFGGPMMGMCVPDVDFPVMKTTNAILAFSRQKERSSSTNCIRCGSCAAVCPMNLLPMELERNFDARNAEALGKLKLNLCLNCGSCTYVCPAKRKLAEKHQLAKAFVKQSQK